MSNDDKSTSLNVGEKGVLDSIFLKVLLAHGWKLEDGVAIASKLYQTAVGLKQALIYSLGTTAYYKVTADYQSQGRNILSTTSVLIEKALSNEEIEALAINFISEIDAVVADSYAARLKRLEKKEEAGPVTLSKKGFIFQEMEISNPTLSSCGRFNVDPKEVYGFYPYATGGGCYALQLDVNDGGYIWLTDFEGIQLPPTEVGQPFLMGFFNKDGEQTAIFELKVGVPQE